jgi:hypothetical protein
MISAWFLLLLLVPLGIICWLTFLLSDAPEPRTITQKLWVTVPEGYHAQELEDLFEYQEQVRQGLLHDSETVSRMHNTEKAFRAALADQYASTHVSWSSW